VTGPPQNRSRRLMVALVINVALVAVQAVAAARAHSTGLLSDAGHNLTDVAAIGLSLLAVRWAVRPRSASRSFGNHRGTILAALVNAVALAVVTVVIVMVSVERLIHPRPVDGGLVAVVAAVAIAANLGSALVLRDGSRDLNMRTAMMHMLADVVSSVVVLVAGAIIWATGGGWERLDPAAALVVAALIVVEAVRLSKESIDVLLESTPSDVDPDRLRQAMRDVGGVADVHDLHVWSLSSEVRALSAHLVLQGHPTLEEAQVVGVELRRRVEGPFGIAHSTFELECERCTDEREDPCTMDEVFAVPASVRPATVSGPVPARGERPTA
jgi:cobalt-zinc-cadmium efflux system protein